MSSKKKASKNKTRLNEENDNHLAFLFIVLMVITPFMVHMKVIDFTAPRIIEPIVNSGLHSDIFSYWKMITVICITIIALIFLIYKMLAHRYTLQQNYLNVPLLILMILVLLSTFKSDYKNISLMGLYNQCDGALLFSAYLALCLVAVNTVFKPWFKRGVTSVLAVLTIINCIIILCHFGGVQLLHYQFIKNLLAPSEFGDYLTGEIWSTLGHPNYISGFAATLFSFFAVGALLESKWRARMGYVVLTLAAFAIVLASLSSSGFVSIVIISPLLIVIAIFSRNKKQTLLAGGVIVILCCGIFAAMSAYNPRVNDETIGFFKHNLNLSQKLQSFTSPRLTELFAIGPSTACAAEEPVSPGEDFNLPESGWAAGTGRVFIWAQTINLIKERPLLGYGLGTLAYYFPQNNINNIANIGDYDTLVTKAHNTYLDIAYGCGLPALLAFLTLLGLHFYNTLRRLWQDERSESFIFSAALFLFFCTFAVQWLFNDMVVDASAIFWTLLGVGASLNQGAGPASSIEK